MKNCILICSLCLLYLAGEGQSLYGNTFKNIDGTALDLGAFKNTKLMIFLAPISEMDALKLHEIDSFYSKNAAQIKLLGIVALEQGYVDSNKQKIKNMYSSRGIEIVLTEAMYTEVPSMYNQSELVQWLIKRSKNGRFEVANPIIGYKFFIDPSGKLYSVLPPEVSLLSKPAERIVKRQF